MRSFIDTNLLVYVDAGDEKKKQRRAIERVRQLRSDGSGVLSTQVLQEYVNVALKKLRLAAEQIRSRLAVYERFEVVLVSSQGIGSALDLTASEVEKRGVATKLDDSSGQFGRFLASFPVTNGKQAPEIRSRDCPALAGIAVVNDPSLEGIGIFG